MPQIVIPIYFDYASTLCYVAWRIVGQLERELGFTAMWKGVPIALRNYRTRPGKPLGPRELETIRNVAAETGIPVEPAPRLGRARSRRTMTRSFAPHSNSAPTSATSRC